MLIPGTAHRVAAAVADDGAHTEALVQVPYLDAPVGAAADGPKGVAWATVHTAHLTEGKTTCCREESQTVASIVERSSTRAAYLQQVAGFRSCSMSVIAHALIRCDTLIMNASITHSAAHSHSHTHRLQSGMRPYAHALGMHKRNFPLLACKQHCQT